MLDMQVRDLLDAGVNVGIGVDGTASNDTGHVLMELRMAMLLQRAGGNPKGTPKRQGRLPQPLHVASFRAVHEWSRAV